MKRVTKSSAKEVVKKFLQDMKQKRKDSVTEDYDQSKSAYSAVFPNFPSTGNPNVTIEDYGMKLYRTKDT